MTTLIGLSQNIALLFSLTFIYGRISPRLGSFSQRSQDIIRGLVFGMFAGISMTLPIPIQPGLFFDGRTVIIIISGIYGGSISAVIVALIVTVYRLALGGIGAPGGVASAVTAAVIGILVHSYYQKRGRTPQARVLLTAGVIQAAAGSLWAALISGISINVILTAFPVTFLLYPLGLLLIGTLITSQQRSLELERALHEDERRFRAIFDSAFQLTGLLNPDGTLLEANQAALDFAAVPLHRLIGQPFWETPWWAATAQEQLKDAVKRAASGEFIRYEVDLQGTGKRTMTIDFSLKPVQDEQGKVVMLIFEGRDLTARKELEQQKLDLGLERERAHLLKKFISDVSHDLRTPLAVMRLNLELLRRTTDPIKQQQRMDTLASQEQHLTRLLTDMMTMLTLDDEQAAFHFKPLDVNFVAQMMIDRNHTPAQNKQQQVIFKHAPEPLMIKGDQVELERALNKLFANALNYTPNEGIILFSVFRDRTNAVIELRDTGVGISPDDLPNIFQRFFRADQARSMDTGGAGLGLSIVKKIVEAHDGSIEVESIVGQGSTFRLLLPLLMGVPNGKLPTKL
ncbi:MAG: ATP-binding protein [Chloroflexota bacterium]